MRRIEISKIEYPHGLTHRPVKTPDGFGWFHGLGIDYEEFESGPGQFTCAVVEREDGTLSMVPLGAVRFLEPEPAPCLDLARREAV
jgi:hypothetical protein